MCLILIENLNNDNSIEIFVSSEDFANLDEIKDFKAYKENMLFNLFIYSTNFEKVNELFSKTIVKKLCSYIAKFEQLNEFKINFIKITIFQNNIRINYDISENLFNYNDIISKND